MAMGADVVRKPVVQLLLSSGQWLRGRAGHEGMRMNNTFVPLGQAARKVVRSIAAVRCGRRERNTATVHTQRVAVRTFRIARPG